MTRSPNGGYDNITAVLVLDSLNDEPVPVLADDDDSENAEDNAGEIASEIRAIAPIGRYFWAARLMHMALHR